MGLEGKNALVCGASQGIGQATAEALAAAGARVCLLARTREKLETVKAGLAQPERHRVIALDIADRAALAREVQGVLNDWAQIHILVNNSGGPKAGPIVEAEDEAFLDGLQRHVLAASFLVQQLLPGMKAAGYGRVINIISTSVKIPIPNLGVSNSIRGCVANWAKTLSHEVAPFGVTVNNVLPGFTDTPRLSALMSATAQRLNKREDEVEAMWRASVPARRFARPQEVAAAVAFLASEPAAYITGINLPVDGGRTGCL